MATIPTDRHITYQLQYRKCGKPTCGTCKAGPGHGKYFYAYWRGDDKKLRSAYVGKQRPAGMTDAEAQRHVNRLARTTGQRVPREVLA